MRVNILSNSLLRREAYPSGGDLTERYYLTTGERLKIFSKIMNENVTPEKLIYIDKFNGYVIKLLIKEGASPSGREHRILFYISPPAGEKL